MSVMHVSRRWILATGAYAAVIAALTWSWASNPGGFDPAEAATFVLLMPTALLTLPLTYLVLSLVWNVTGSSVSQDDVPTVIAAGYALWFALLAVVNAGVLTAAYRAGYHVRRPHPGRTLQTRR
jgi:hypothetical protein